MQYFFDCVHYGLVFVWSEQCEYGNGVIITAVLMLIGKLLLSTLESIDTLRIWIIHTTRPDETRTRSSSSERQTNEQRRYRFRSLEFIILPVLTVQNLYKDNIQFNNTCLLSTISIFQAWTRPPCSLVYKRK